MKKTIWFCCPPLFRNGGLVFTKRILGMEGLNYRERLFQLRMYSQERRTHRYMLILIRKSAMGLIDGYNLQFHGEQSRRGRQCQVTEVVRTAPTNVWRARERSLSVTGAKKEFWLQQGWHIQKKTGQVSAINCRPTHHFWKGEGSRIKLSSGMGCFVESTILFIDWYTL